MRELCIQPALGCVEGSEELAGDGLAKLIENLDVHADLFLLVAYKHIIACGMGYNKGLEKNIADS